MASAVSAKIFRIDQLFAPAAQTATANGSSVDLKGTANPGVQEHRAVISLGAVTGTTPTLVVKMQDSPDNSVWTDIATAATGTLNAANANTNTDLYFRTANRYVRAVLTIGGTTPSYTMAVNLHSASRVA